MNNIPFPDSEAEHGIFEWKLTKRMKEGVKKRKKKRDVQ
jgi:hypothetical protein